MLIIKLQELFRIIRCPMERLTLQRQDFFHEERAEKREVILVYCKSKEQLADVFTKSLLVNKFEFLRPQFRICSS